MAALLQIARTAAHNAKESTALGVGGFPCQFGRDRETRFPNESGEDVALGQCERWNEGMLDAVLLGPFDARLELEKHAPGIVGKGDLLIAHLVLNGKLKQQNSNAGRLSNPRFIS